MDIKNILEGDNLNPALRIAFLAEFSKACNIIGTQDYEEIADLNNVRGINQSVLGVEILKPNEYKNSNDKVSIDKFTTEFVKIVNSCFFNLLTTDADFQKSMAGPMTLSYLNRLPMSRILAKIKDRTNLLMQSILGRIQDGEFLTEESIVKEIDDFLIKNKDDLANDLVQVADPPKKPTDYNYYNPIPPASAEILEKGIRWRSIKGMSISPKELKRIEQQTKKIKENLEKVKSGINTARAIVALLKKLESTFALGYIGILKTLSKIIFSFVRDIGSTGVYMLNMMEPYISSEPFYDKEELLKSASSDVDKAQEAILMSYIEDRKIYNSYDYLYQDSMRNNMFFDQLVRNQDRVGLAGDYIKESQDEWIKSWGKFYKPTTYAEFISTIASAFQDEGDLPGDSALNQHIINNYFYTSLGIQRGTIKRTQSPITMRTNQKYGQNFDLDYIRTGRPRFGVGSNAVVIIVAFSMPNIIDLIARGAAAFKSFLYFISFFASFFVSIYKNDKTINKWFTENTAVGKRFARLWKKIIKKNLFDQYEDPPYLDENGDPTVPTDISQSPDFYGLSLRTFLPSFFELMDTIEVRIDKYMKNFKSSLSKEIDNLLKNIEEAIDDLEDFIDIIDQIITFFDLLKTSGASTLKIESTGGIDDIVEKLLTAEDFPGVKEGDPLRMIGGFVYCYGAASPSNLGKIDFKELVRQKMSMINYQAALDKYESDGKDEEDDPGSLDDYLKSQSLGDINKSLDKIFKSLF